MSNITAYDYFKAYPSHPEITGEIHENAVELLGKVNTLLDECEANGWEPHINPVTKTLISGEMNGGWRPSWCPIGAPNSSHKQGRGVDIFDHRNELDAMITDDLLERHGLYREHPDATVNKMGLNGWVHLTTRSPRSGKRTFWP